MMKNHLIWILIYALVALSPANAADFVLEIYGNANMDEYLNQDDLDYINDIVSGKIEPTKLADANFDGKVDEEDIAQIQAILEGREEKLTFIDMLGEPVTINKPIRRLVNMGYNGVEMTRILGAEDILVAYGQDRTEHAIFFPKVAELPFVGNDPNDCDYEMIVSLKPDAVQTNIERASFTVGGLDQKRIFENNLKDIPLISLNMREQDTLVKNVRTYGYILDREQEAEEFIDWYSKYYDLFVKRTASLSDDERPRCVIEYTPYYCYASGSSLGQVLALAGGKNILDKKIGPDDPKYGSMLDIEPEFVVREDPEYIFKAVGSWDSGYQFDNSRALAAYKEQVMNRTELANTAAVRGNDVYCMSFWILIGAGNNIIGTSYVAKLLHPDLFEDIDPSAIHQEYVDRFCRIDFDVKEQGAFLYPPYNRWPVGA